MFSGTSVYEHAQAFSEFQAYKTRVPVRGAILLNEGMDQVVLVKGWKKGANWSFPRGKINQNEPDLDCAVREVYEETGYDIEAAGLVEAEKEKHIDMNLREQEMRLYVFRGIPMDTYFEPRTRKEISKIQWWRLSDLPTLKKKKQQQEGKADDLAVNANKFYMVAPFIPQLKKWINGQKKIDKARQSSQAVVIEEEEPAPVEVPGLPEDLAEPPSMDEFTNVLEKLRQSAVPSKASDLPEVSEPPTNNRDLSSQLRAILKVPATPIQDPSPQEAVNEASIASTVKNQNSMGLLALFQGKPPVQTAQPPRTPAEQVYGHSPAPKSPSHPHYQRPRFSTLPPPPTFPLSTSQDQELRAQPQPPMVRPIPSPQQPAQLIPRAIHPQHQRPPPRANLNPQTIAPYQRTGDPQFAQHAHAPGNQPLSIPPASNLPAPKLNAQSFTLLNLFKTGPPTKEIISDNQVKAPANTVAQAAAAAGLPNFGKKLEAILNNAKAPQTSPQEQYSVSNGSPALASPQILPVTQITKAPGAGRPKSEHHDKLLNLFRSPSVAEAVPARVEAPASLQLPSTPVELSALPSTPGHSRELSRKDQSAQKAALEMVQSTPSKVEKSPRQDPAKLPRPPVSATVNGPLNVPQFDVLAKAARDAKQAAKEHGSAQQQKRSPITILARPGSSNGPPPAAPVQTDTLAVPKSKHNKTAAPKIQTFTTPTIAPPQAPDLKGQEILPKPFHPQILRRPANHENLNEPSPIQPLPSPTHKILADRRSTQPTDHKKSLLSLFSRPTPSVSPPSANEAPASALDPTSFLSPAGKTPTPQEQAEGAFARLTKSVGAIGADPHEDKVDFTPRQPVLSRKGSTNEKVTEGVLSGRTSGKHTPTKTTTPIDKSFLLSYLEGVAKAGR